MKRIFAVAAVLAIALGCRGPSQVYDPFLGRTTVDPPGTAVPPPGQPYYGAPPVTSPPATVAPPAAVAPAPRVGTPNFTPTPAGGAGLSSSFTPNVSPTQPVSSPPGKAAALPLTPVSNSGRPAYLPPGGSGPQARFVPGGSPTPAQVGPSVAGQTGPPAALDVDRILASRGTSISAASSSGSSNGANSSADASAARSGATPVAFSSPGSTIRIVEPAGSTAAGRAGEVGNATSTSPLAATGAAPGIFHPAGPTSAIIPSGTASAGTLSQSASATSSASAASATPSRIPEISELPPATGGAFATATPTKPGIARVTTPSASILANQASPLSTGTADTGTAALASARGANLNAPSTENGSGYAFDPQYHSLKGKLEYSQSTNQWRLRYIPPDGSTTDNYGGSVILADAGKLNGLHAGDFVAVQGTPGAPSATAGSFAPLYNVDRIQKQ